MKYLHIIRSLSAFPRRAWEQENICLTLQVWKVGIAHLSMHLYGAEVSGTHPPLADVTSQMLLRQMIMQIALPVAFAQFKDTEPVQSAVQTIALQQIFVHAFFDDSAVFKYINPVGLFHCAEPMGNYKGGAFF